LYLSLSRPYADLSPLTTLQMKASVSLLALLPALSFSVGLSRFLLASLLLGLAVSVLLSSQMSYWKLKLMIYSVVSQLQTNCGSEHRTKDSSNSIAGKLEPKNCSLISSHSHRSNKWAC